MAITGDLDSQIIKTFAAGADLSAAQYYFVKLSSGLVVLCDTAGEEALGVLQNAPTAAGKAAEVLVFGRSKVKAGGTITAGAPIKTSTAGKALAAVLGTVNTSDTGASSDAVVGSNVMGKSLEVASSADGDIIDCLINSMGVIPTTAA